MSRPAIKRGFQPEWLFENGFSAAQILVLVYVQMRGQCWERKDVIAQKLRMGKGKLKRTLDELVALQWLVKSTKITNKKRANCYKLAPVEGIRADEKKRQTHFAKPHVRPQTNALKSTNIAIEEEARQQNAENAPSNILSMNLSDNEMRRRRGPGLDDGHQNDPKSHEDTPQDAFEAPAAQDSAQPIKNPPVDSCPFEWLSKDWITWCFENGHDRLALLEICLSKQVKREKRKAWA
jgi:DNA-binding MarR family transcriptional regulator